MFSIKSAYITVPHESHNTILCLLTTSSMVHVALRQITAQYQIQISDENTCMNECEMKLILRSTVLRVKK